MKITPIEIRQKSFEKAFRGYEKEEVDAFLYSLSQEWEKVMEENKELKKRLDVSEKEVQRLRDVENSLFKTIKNAETTGANVLENAQKAAELHIREAQIRAEGVLNESRNRSRNMIEEAEEKVREIMYDIQEEVNAIVKEYHQIEDQKEYLLESLHSVAQELFEKVERARVRSNRKEFDKRLKDIKDLSAEKKTLDFESSYMEDFSNYKKRQDPEQKLRPEPSNLRNAPRETPVLPKEEVKPVVKDPVKSDIPVTNNSVQNPLPEQNEGNAAGSFFDTI